MGRDRSLRARSERGLEVRARWVVLLAALLPQMAQAQEEAALHLGDLRPSGVLRLADTPSVSIGDGSAPEYELFQVQGAVRLTDGRFAILNGGSNEVRVYSPEGRFVTSIGREGQGPGEFMAADRLFRGLADSLIVWDSRSVRASVVTADAGFVRTIPLEASPQAPRLEGVDSKGRLLVVAPDFGASSSPEIRRLTERRFLYDGSGRLIDTLGASPGMTGVIRGAADRMEIQKPLVAPTTTYAIGGSILWIETGEARALEYVDLETGVDHVVSWDGPDLTMTPAYRQAIIRDLAARVPEEMRVGYRASLERRPVPPTIPATARVLADRMGRGWLELAPTPGGRDRTEWIVFGVDGRPEAKLGLDRSISILSVLDDAVIVVERDEFDVERVSLYRLEGT